MKKIIISDRGISGMYVIDPKRGIVHMYAVKVKLKSQVIQSLVPYKFDDVKFSGRFPAFNVGKGSTQIANKPHEIDGLLNPVSYICSFSISTLNKIYSIEGNGYVLQDDPDITAIELNMENLYI